jgi:hypothetical protein
MVEGREFQSLGATLKKALSLKLRRFNLVTRWPAVVEWSVCVGWSQRRRSER